MTLSCRTVHFHPSLARAVEYISTCCRVRAVPYIFHPLLARAVVFVNRRHLVVDRGSAKDSREFYVDKIDFIWYSGFEYNQNCRFVLLYNRRGYEIV